MALSISRHGGRFLTARRIVLAVISGLALVAVLGTLALAAPGPAYDVRGNAEVPYDAGKVKEVRVLDSITVYVDGEPKPGFTTLGGIALIVLATAALMTAFVLRIATTRRRLVAFYLCRRRARLRGRRRALRDPREHRAQPAVPGRRAGGIAPRRSHHLAVRLARGLVCVRVPRCAARRPARGARARCRARSVALSAAGDLSGQKAIEEYFELFSGLCIAAGLALLMHTHLRRNLRPQLDVPEEVTVVDQRRGRGRGCPPAPPANASASVLRRRTREAGAWLP